MPATNHDLLSAPVIQINQCLRRLNYTLGWASVHVSWRSSTQHSNYCANSGYCLYLLVVPTRRMITWTMILPNWKAIHTNVHRNDHNTMGHSAAIFSFHLVIVINFSTSAITYLVHNFAHVPNGTLHIIIILFFMFKYREKHDTTWLYYVWVRPLLIFSSLDVPLAALS